MPNIRHGTSGTAAPGGGVRSTARRTEGSIVSRLPSFGLRARGRSPGWNRRSDYRMGTISFPIQAHRCPVYTPISFPFSGRPVPESLGGSTEFTARSNPLMARLHLPGAANLTVIRRPEANPVAIGHDLRWWAAWVAVTLTEPLEEVLRTRLTPLRDTGWPFLLHLHNVTENRPPAIAISHQNASRPLRSATRPALTSAGVPRRCAPRWRPPSSGPQAPPAACRA